MPMLFVRTLPRSPLCEGVNGPPARLSKADGESGGGAPGWETDLRANTGMSGALCANRLSPPFEGPPPVLLERARAHTPFPRAGETAEASELPERIPNIILPLFHAGDI